MIDLPEHLIPKTEFNLISEPPNSEVNSIGVSSSVGLSEADQKLIDVYKDPKHASALEILLEERRAQLNPEPSVIPESDPKVDNLVAYLETQYWMEGGYPFFDDLRQETGYTESQMRQTLLRASSILTQRGLPSYALPPGPEDSIFKEWTSKYDPRFVLAANMISNVTDKRSVSAKLNEIEVTPAEWDGWLTNDSYYKYYKLLVETRWSQLDEIAKLGIIRGVHMGDLKTIQYYHEFTGKHVQTTAIQVNIGSVLQRVVEVLATHLSPDMLNTVANELSMENLMEATSRELL